MSEKTRLLSLSLPQLGAWLLAAPIPVLGLHLLPNEFRAAVKYRAGAPIYEKERNCSYCKFGFLDTLGDHAVACLGRGDMISRHDRLRDKTFSACSAANLSPVCEQENLIPETNSRPGNMYLPCWSAGQPAALDITITSPLQPSIISNAARKSGVALRAAEDRKLEQFSQQCANIGVQFFPLAFESVGGLSELLRKILKRRALLDDNRIFYSAGLVSCFQQARAIGFSHTNARKRYNVDSKKRRTVSQLQAKEASLMSHDFRLSGIQYPNCKPNNVSSTILVENPIVWILLFQLKTRLIKFN